MKDLLDRSVALAPGCVLAVVLLAVLDVQVADPVVVLLDVGDRVITGGEEVADVEVDPEVLRQRHGLREALRRRELVGVLDVVVAVHGDDHLVLIGERSHALGRAQGRRRGDDLDAQGLGHLEAAIDLLVAEAVVEAEL